MSNYRLAHEDAHAYTIMENTGHTFKVAKAGLRQDIHNRIKKLPGMNKMAEGGVVEEDDTDAPIADTASEGAVETPDEEQPMPAVSAPQSPQAQPNQAPVPINVNQPFLNQPNAQAEQNATQAPKQGIMGMYNQNEAQQIKGVQGIADAKSKEAREVANASALNEVKQAESAEKYAQELNGLKQKHDVLFKEINEGKIKPNSVWNDMSTGNKALASIGMLLSGVGSGIGHTQNLAMQTLDKLQDDDIAAQKANLGKKENLLSQNLQQQRDLVTAEGHTRLQMNTALQAQIAKAAAQSGSQIAQANAQMMIAQLKQQRIPIEQNLAMMAVKAQSLGTNGPAGFPVGQEPQALLGDKDYQAKRVVVGGRAFQAVTPKEAGELRNIQTTYEPVKKMMQQLSDLGPSALVPGSDDYQKATALVAKLIPTVNKMHGLTRLTEEDIHIMKDQLRDPRSFLGNFSGDTKTQTFLSNLADDVDEAYKTKLINYKGPSQYKSFTPLGKGQ